MDICNKDPYQDYYRIVKIILKYIYLSQGKDISDKFTFDSFSIKPTNRFNDISTRVIVTDSYPTGTRAHNAMAVLIYFYADSVKNFHFKYDRLNGNISIGWIKTVLCDVPHSFSNYQSDNLEDILIHVEKFMKIHIILPILKDMYGKSCNLEEIDDSSYEMISMYKI